MRLIYLSATLCTLLTIVGCNTTRQHSANVQKTDPALHRTLNQHDQQIASLTFKFNQLKESNKTCVTYINKLNKQVALLNRKATALEQANRQLTLQLKNEKITRQNEMDKLLQSVAKETADAINTMRTQSRRQTTPTRTKSTSGPAMPGEFYEYTVEQGATLSVIARAYKVSVADIKKANRLKSDIIRVGQKLYIPKK